MFQSLEFIIHPEKRKFVPSKKVEYLGFVIDSKRMVTYLSDHKKKKIYDKCQSISKKQDLKIRDVASFIGTLTSTFPANEYGPLYYRVILKNKDDFLEANKASFNARIDLTKNALQEIKWWENNIFYTFKPIKKVKISKVIYTDVSLDGWGASYGNTPTRGILELKATFLALKAFVKTKNEHVKIMCDNTTAISCITIDWSGLKFYAFLLIAITSRVLSKISKDEAEGIIVVPYWPNQVWYPVMLKMLISVPILLNSRKSLLQLPVARSESPNVAKDGHDCATLIGFLQKSSTMSKAAIEIISASWRQGTEKCYNGHIKRFVDFYHKRQADPLCAT